MSENIEYEGGSLMGMGSPFQIGDLVSLHSYKGENNLWNITNMGDEFITIEKNGLMNGGGSHASMDDIQIVQPMDICHANSMLQPQPMIPQQQLMPSFQQPIPSFQKTPDVNIVLVNGNNNEVDGATVQKPNTIDKKGGSMSEAVVIGNEINGGNSGNVEKNQEKVETEKPEKTVKGGSSFWGGIFDTANLLVKKTG